jgi:RNA polymerase sigma-B factor
MSTQPRSTRSTLFPSDTHERVDEQLRNYRRTGDRSPRNAAVEAMMPLVDLLARRYQRRDASVEDLRQVALIAVVRAADRFDPDRGVHFATFVSRTIEGELKRYHRDRTWIVRPARQMQELYLRVRSAEEELTHVLSRSPTVAELANELDETVDHVLEALQVSAIRTRTELQENPSAGSDDRSSAPRRAVAGRLDEGFDQVDRTVVISQVLAKLPTRERRVLEMRFFENRSQQDIADELGVTQSYLSRLLRQTLTNVRARLDGAMAAADPIGVDAHGAVA